MPKLKDCKTFQDLEQKVEDIELTPGPQGPAGEDGQDGADGQDGVDGQDGQDGVDGLEAPLSNAIPIPDNEVDTNIRTGQAGTSGNVSRADHNHPIRRQANPGDPTITTGGTFVLLQSLILDRGSDEESYWYRFRVRVSQTAGNNWGWLTIPSIAGFQQPIFSEVGGYMTQSIAVQDDDNSFGASPRGPWMGYPIHHWSSTNRLYGGFFRRDNNVTSLYINFVVKYTRT